MCSEQGDFFDYCEEIIWLNDAKKPLNPWISKNQNQNQN